MKFRVVMKATLFSAALLGADAVGPGARADGSNIIVQCFYGVTSSRDGVDSPDGKGSVILKITPEAWSTWDKNKSQWISLRCKNHITCEVQDTFLEQKISEDGLVADDVINRQTGKYTSSSIFSFKDADTNESHTSITKYSGQCAPTADPSLSTGPRQF